jgi:uncharacterized protein (DUF1684 family)
LSVAGEWKRGVYRRGWRGWRKHVLRRWGVLKPDDLMSWIGMSWFVAVGLVGMYVAGTIGLYAAATFMVLVVFVVGVAIRTVKRVVRATRTEELQKP